MRRRIVQRPSRAAFYHDTGFGEFFVGHSGVTFSDPRIADGAVAPDDISCREIDAPWFEEESTTALGALATSSVYIEGDLGAGKSSALYGLRTLLRQKQEPYIYIDGHYTNRASRQRPAIHSALVNNRPTVIIDSFDYWFLRSAVNRKSRTARELLVPELIKHHEQGGKVVVTSHTKPWLDTKSTSELQNQMQEALPTNIIRLRVGGELKEERLKKLCELVGDAMFAEAYVDLARDSLPTARTYRVAKQMAVRGIELAGISPQAFTDAVRGIDQETRTKMGAADSYCLV